MQRVPDKVLQWLYNSLKPQYENVDRAYSDVAKTLAGHDSFSPRTDVYTFDNGTSALLLVLHGTLSVLFRGATYRFPLAIWMPYTYPREAPMIYVTPTSGMVVRPGQHVSIEGRIYHPYLAHWRDHWNMSNVLDLLSILRDIFAKEPPVVSRQPQELPRSDATIRNSPVGLPTQTRQLSPSVNKESASTLAQRSRPPVPPPKPPEVSGLSQRLDDRTGIGNESPVSSRPPSLPPKPSHPNGYPRSPNVETGFVSASPIRHATPYERIEPVMARAQTMSLPADVSFPRELKYDARAQISPVSGSHVFQRQVHQGQALPAASDSNQGYASHQPLAEYRAYPPPASQFPNQSSTFASQSFPVEARKPIEDILSAPVEARSQESSSTTRQSAPPIPPNPEKDAIVQAISTALQSQLEQSINQNNAALPALEAQHAAMQQAYQNMQNELSQLQHLDEMLSSNEKILHEAMREADRVMESVGRRDVPKVDDVLVAPTIVGEQLYKLVADVRGISDAMFALTRALDKGRIGADTFIKQTRTLARERFFKEALIKKIAKGMGLAMQDR